MEKLEGIDAQMDKAAKTLATMLDYLGLEASIKAENKGSKIVLLTSSENAGRIIGRKGQSLESLQLLLNRMMLKIDENFPRVFIDVDGYSSARPEPKRNGSYEERRGDHEERRGGYEEQRGDHEGRRGGFDRRRSDEEGGGEQAETLRQQALDAAKEVKRWGEPVVLPPMNAHDRRIIHITLRDDTELETVSEGGDKLKKVTISLKKKGEDTADPVVSQTPES